MKRRMKEVITLRCHTTSQLIHEGECGLPTRCMNKLAAEIALRKIDPDGGDHRVKIMAGALKFVLWGWRYEGVLPTVATNSLIVFDEERSARIEAKRNGTPFRSRVRPFRWLLRAVAVYKLKRITRARQDQINEARRQRILEGRPDKPSRQWKRRVTGLVKDF